MFIIERRIKGKMNIPTDNGGRIDIQNESITIPIFFSNKLDIEGMQSAFNECIEELIDKEERVLKEFGVEPLKEE